MTRKILTLTLALVMVLGIALTGCSGNSGNSTTAATTTAATTAADTTAADTTAAGTEELDAVTLTWYNASDAFRNDKSEVNLEVADALNEYFAEQVNATIDWKWYGWSDYSEKTTAAVNADQQVDILFTSQSTFPFSVWQKSGAFADLTDLLQTYASETYTSIPEWVWKAASVDGRIYAMPTYKDVAVNHPLIYNKSLLQEVGLEEELLNLEWSVVPDLSEFFYKVKEARDAAHPEWANDPLFKLPGYGNGCTLSPYIQGDELTAGVWTSIPGTTSLAGDEYANGTKAVNIFTTKDYIDGMLINKQWVEDGIAPYDQPNWDTEGEIQKSGSMIGDISWGVVSVNEDEKENYKQGIVQPLTSFTYTGYPQAVMQAISAFSDYPERAMMVLNLVFSDTYVSTSLRFGVEGKGWNRVTINGVERAGFAGTYNEDPTKRSSDGFYLWYHAEQGNLFSCLLPEDQADDFYVNLEAMNDSAAVSPNLGFLFDTTNVVNEVAAVSNVISEYQTDIFFGMLDDVEGRIDSFVEKLNDNRIDKVIDEVQSQLDAWRATNG